MAEIVDAPAEGVHIVLSVEVPASGGRPPLSCTLGTSTDVGPEAVQRLRGDDPVVVDMLRAVRERVAEHLGVEAGR